ncbi:MAG: cell division protein FtsZ [Holosporales bacterium]|jgi:cell division protein FtsZ|nr:cell division protein FtsZ [Holosporales bacterium]
MVITNAELKIDVNDLRPKIIVIGVGGAGGNAVNNMIRSNLEGVSFVAANTDAQALQQSLVDTEHRVQLGANITQGLGAGSKPEVGGAAAEESIEDLMSFVTGANMVFITAGMGGGTGTGAAPVIARAAREVGILTVGVVTKPFAFEGSNRTKIAERGIEELQQYVDTLLIIPNQNLFRLANEDTTFADAFKMADNVLYSGVRGVTDLMIMPGLINLDFADIRAIMSEMGKAMMGTGEAEGDRRALDAAEAAISNPLLDDVSLQGASGVLINITGGFDMTLYEVDEAANRIREEVEADANIIFGSTFDDRLNGKMRVSVVATGIGNSSDVNAFKNMDIAAGFNSSHKNAAIKMFEGIDPQPKQHKTQQLQDNIDENYQEEIIDYVEDVDYESPIPKKPSSFFDRFRSRGSFSENDRANDSRYQKRTTPTSMPKQPEVLQQQSVHNSDNNDEEDYDIPSCFRRKK